MAELQDQVQTYTQAARAPGASPAGPQTTELVISGMTCASCARRVERALSHTSGVSEANANLATEHAQVTYDPASASLSDLIHSVERAGYGASSPAPATTAGLIGPADSDSSAPDAETVRRQLDLRRTRRTLALGVALSVPVVILSMFFMDRFAFENYLLLALTLPVWGYVGWASQQSGCWQKSCLGRRLPRWSLCASKARSWPSQVMASTMPPRWSRQMLEWRWALEPTSRWKRRSLRW